MDGSTDARRETRDGGETASKSRDRFSRLKKDDGEKEKRGMQRDGWRCWMNERRKGKDIGMKGGFLAPNRHGDR